MAFWDNLGQKASETAAKAKQKAKEISDVVKFNSMISDEEAKIQDYYVQIGKRYVSVHRQDAEEEFAELMNSIDESERKIAAYKKQVQQAKGVQNCEKCGAEVEVGVAFCSSCGAAMPQIQPIEEEKAIKCDHCGTMVKTGTRFCTGCGASIKQTTDQPVAEKICPKCGTKLPADGVYCTECGTKLEDSYS